MLAALAIRAHYALRHPDYALWLLTVGEAQDYQKRLETGGANLDTIVAAANALNKAEERFPALTEQAKAARWKDLQFKAMFEEIATTEQHGSLYRWPSVFIHGDPIGMREMFRPLADGSIAGVIRLADPELNSDFVDAVSMMIEFLRAYQMAFPALQSNEEATSHIAEIARENMVHSLRFPQERPEEYLAQARVDLGIAPSI